jgi:tetratricopeptide (TPR) repeat protein
MCMKSANQNFIRLLVVMLVLAGFTAAKFNPKAARRFLVRGQYAAMNGSYKTALKHMNKAILIKPDYDTAYYHRGVLKSTVQDINGAIADFSQAIRLNPKFSLSYFSRGTLYLQHGHQQKALTDFDAAIQINPQFYDALNNKAVLLNAMGKAPQARQIYDSLLVSYEKRSSKKENQQNWPLVQHPTETQKAYAALETRVPRLYFNRSFIKVQSNDLEGALEDLNKALHFNPYDYAAYYQRGEVLVQLKQYKAALQAFEKARSLRPAVFYGHLNLGKAYAAAGQSRKAIVIFNQAIRRNQRSGEAYYLRGSERLKQRKMEEAYSDLRLAKILGFQAAAEKLQQLDAPPRKDQF